ncbi:MAG: sensor histidine kinase [Planctomycetota bacterium]|nr:MAG: sensor histidine kinase [Planctomycetota bacterium]
MRWSIRHQLLLPMLGITIVPMILLVLVCGFLASRELQEQDASQVGRLGETLAAAEFPLTEHVLLQLRGLSGAEFVLADRHGNVIDATFEDDRLRQLPDRFFSHPDRWAQPEFDRGLLLGDVDYRVRAIPRTRRGRRDEVLWIFYPQDRARPLMRGLVLGLAAAALPAAVLAALASAWLASRFRRRIGRLSAQTSRIAEGRFVPIPEPVQEDELGELARSINQMTERLAQYRDALRRAEQLRVVDHLAASLAHQLRNAVTGALFAVEIHADECPAVSSDDDSLDVARRQLELMENYLRRFLELGRHGEPRRAVVEANKIVERAVELLRPRCRHAGITLDAVYDPSDAGVSVCCDEQAVTQAVVNLVVNAVDAVEQRREAEPGRVRVSVVRNSAGDDGVARCVVAVEDNGPGPSEKVRGELFEPFVSDKNDGTGLGLWAAANIASAHGGTVSWRRANGVTRFELILPCNIDEDGKSTSTSRCLEDDSRDPGAVEEE